MCKAPSCDSSILPQKLFRFTDNYPNTQGLPDITLKQLNEQLSFFGFLPLTESHTLVSGEYQDWLLIQLFQLYEKKCHSFSKEEKLLWFQNACRILDHYFIRTGHPKLRFMHFKALDL